MEAPSQVIVDASRPHGVELPERHLVGVGVALGLERRVAHQEVEVRDRGELGSGAEPAVLGIVDALQRLVAVLDQRGARARPGVRLDRRGERFEDLPSRSLDLRALREPRLVDPRQHVGEPGTPEARVGREVRAAEERAQVGGEEHVEGPSAAHAHRLHGRHVDAIHVGPLLPVHLDGNEPSVEQFRHRVVLERFALHHVAPVAGGVADREEDRLLLAPRLLERLLAPGIPVHRVVGVLEQVGALLADQPVGLAVRLDPAQRAERGGEGDRPRSARSGGSRGEPPGGAGSAREQGAGEEPDQGPARHPPEPGHGDELHGQTSIRRRPATRVNEMWSGGGPHPARRRGGSAAASRPAGRRGEIETAGSRGPRRWIGPARGRAAPSRTVIWVDYCPEVSTRVSAAVLP